MTSILRQSSALARISKSSFRAAARSSLRPPTHSPLASLRISAQQACGYARNNSPNGPNPPKNNGGKKIDPKLTPKANDSESKQAPGTENLYNRKAPLSPNEPNKPDKPPQASESISENPKLKLSPEEEKALDELFANAKLLKLLPEKELEVVEQAIAKLKKDGMPIEVREFLDGAKDKPPSLGAAMEFMNFMMGRGPQVKGQASGQKTDGQGSGGAGGKDKSGRSSSDKNEPPKLFGKPGDALFNTLAMAVAVTLFTFIPMPGAGKEITYQEFRNTFLDKGLVEKLVVSNGGSTVTVYLHQEATRSMYPDSPGTKPGFHYTFSIGSVEAFERRLEEAQNQLGIPNSERIPVSYAKGSDAWGLFMYLLPTLLFLLPIFWLSRRSGGSAAQSGLFNIGKSRAKQFNHETDVKVKFKDVAGMDEAKQEIMEFVAFLKTPEHFQKLGAKIPRGAILSGPPGTGKTLLAKATAGESEVPFFSVSGSEFVEMFVGVGASRVRDLFAMARKSTPCIIFIDEIDAIGKARGKGGSFGGNDEREATLNQILTEMDGFNTSEQVVVLAGTNRSDVLDKALMRPGRFDRHIAIDRPTMDGRKQIFLVHLGKIVTNENMDYLSGRLAALTPGFAGADIANCCNEAALIGM